MYSGNLLSSLINAYKMHLLQSQPGYFERLKDFYLRHDFPIEFTDKDVPPIPEDLIQQARKINDDEIVNKLIASILKEYNVDSNLNPAFIDKNKALNYYFFPEDDLKKVLYELNEMRLSMKDFNPPKEAIQNQVSSTQVIDFKSNRRLNSVVLDGSSELLKDFPFDKNVFVMMKFSEKNSLKTEDKLLEKIWDTINSTLSQSYGFRALRADQKDYTNGEWLWNNVCVYMESSKFGIAVLENLSSSEFNPNVAIEFGYMKSLGCNILLLKEKSFENIRADLIGRIWKEFSADSESNVKETIENAIHRWAIDLGLKRVSL